MNFCEMHSYKIGSRSTNFRFSEILVPNIRSYTFIKHISFILYNIFRVPYIWSRAFYLVDLEQVAVWVLLQKKDAFNTCVIQYGLVMSDDSIDIFSLYGL